MQLTKFDVCTHYNQTLREWQADAVLADSPDQTSEIRRYGRTENIACRALFDAMDVEYGAGSYTVKVTCWGNEFGQSVGQ